MRGGGSWTYAQARGASGGQAQSGQDQGSEQHLDGEGDIELPHSVQGN